MFRKFVPEFCPNFVIALSIVTIRRSETCEVWLGFHSRAMRHALAIVVHFAELNCALAFP